MAKSFEFKNLVMQDRKKERIKKERVDRIWVIKIVLFSFIVSFLLSFVSESFIPNVSIPIGIFITIFFIVIGILFDIIGVAVTSSNEAVFHSMNSRKVRGAKLAVKMKKNSDKVSSFCCDVIGDICGILSGAAGSAIAIMISSQFHFSFLLTTLFVASIIASLTIGGKAMGKSFAINKSEIILYEFAKMISFFYSG